MRKFFRVFGRVMAYVGVFIGMLLLNLYLTLVIICYGPSDNARNTLVTTFLESGKLKFVPHLLMSSDKINKILDEEKLEDFSEEQDNSKIVIENTSDLIEQIPIYGSNYYGTLMIIHDPSRVSVVSTYPSKGKTLDKLVEENDAVLGINGGLYVSSANAGGRPLGTLVTNGVIQFAESGNGYHLIGFDKDNHLRIIDISKMTSREIKDLINTEGIRDAVTFQEEASDANNHFVKLIINGEKREVKGSGGGSNPRTVIGQREDGAVLLFVTDGRGANGHLGASAKDLIDIMDEYGAVNAANIDGGSSSCMYYNHEYLMTSVTFYYANSSWLLPDGFIVK